MKISIKIKHFMENLGILKYIKEHFREMANHKIISV